MNRTVAFSAAGRLVLGWAAAVSTIVAVLSPPLASGQTTPRAPTKTAPKASVAKPAAPPVLTPEQKTFAEECDTLRRGTILRLEESLRGIKSGHVPTADKAGTIRQTEADIEALRNASRVIVPMLRFPTRVGQIGRLPGGGAYVEQVIGPKEALVRCSFRVNVVVTRDQRPVSEIVRQRPLFKMRGQATTDWDESTDISLEGTFQIVGIERYQTEDGRSASVQVLKPFDMRPIEEYLKRQAAN